MEDLISVIVPVYNVEKYIHKCIDSILNQTYENLEIILVDDGSPDNSGRICDEYAEKDKRIMVIHKENQGVSSARNVGLDRMNGTYVIFIDSDDWVENNCIEILYNKAKENDADVVLCGYNRVVGGNKEIINSQNKEKQFNSTDYLINVLNPQTGFGFCHMKLFNKKCISDIRFQEDLLVGEDALFNEEISKNIRKAIFVKQNLYNYRINENSVVKRFDVNYVEKYLKSMKRNKKYIFNNYKENGIIKQNYYNYVAYHVLLIAVNYCYHPNNKANRKKALKEVCNIDEFKEGIKNSNYENLSLTREITLFTLKYKMYWITKIICMIRQRQNNTRQA